MSVENFLFSSEEWIVFENIANLYRAGTLTVGNVVLALLTLTSLMGVLAITLLQSLGVLRNALATSAVAVSTTSLLVEWYWLLQLIVLHLLYSVHVAKPALLLVVLLLGPGLCYQFAVRLAHTKNWWKRAAQLSISAVLAWRAIVVSVDLVGWHITWLASLLIVPGVFLNECIEVVRGTGTVTTHRAKIFSVAALFWVLYGTVSLVVLKHFGPASFDMAELELRMHSSWSIVLANVIIGASALASLVVQRRAA